MDAPTEVASSSVLAAVSRQLPEGCPPALAATARQLAAAIDLTESARDLTSLSKELRATLADIAAAAVDDSEMVEVDGVDDLSARRAARKAAANVGDGS